MCVWVGKCELTVMGKKSAQYLKIGALRSHGLRVGRMVALSRKSREK